MAYEFICDSHHGQYLPMVFVKNVDCVGFWGFKPEDVETLLEGPENEWYWETWDSVLGYAKHVTEDGRVWRLHQDGDLFAYDENHTFEE